MTLWTSLLSFLGCNSNSKKSNSNPNEDMIEMIDPRNILMSISTIENTLPKTNKQPKDSLDLEILEDDWRQLEFVLKKHQNLINQEIDSISLIIENESVDIGENMMAFKNLHVRKLIPKPLDEGIELTELVNSFSSCKTGSLSFNKYGRVHNGIYFNISNFNLYGLVNNSKVTSFCFYGLSSWDDLETFKTEVKTVMNTYDLVLVDWRSRKIIDSNGLDAFLKPNE